MHIGKIHGSKEFVAFLEAELARRFPVKDEWVIGGYNGGNCWGDDANHMISVNVEDYNRVVASMRALVLEITTLVMPEISNDDFAKIERKSLYRLDKYTDRGWYGNYTEYGTMELDTGVLFTILRTIERKQRGLVC